MKRHYLYNNNNLTLLSNKSLTTESDYKGEEQSQKIAAESLGSIYTPRSNPHYYATMPYKNEVIQSTIKALVNDTLSSLDVTYDDVNWKTSGMDEGEIEKKKQEIEKAVKSRKLLETLRKAYQDYLTTGYYTLEVLRDKDGNVNNLVHIPSHTVRKVLVNKSYIYQQRAYGSTVYFSSFGENQSISYINGRTTNNKKEKATELIMYSSYSPIDEIYGTPIYYNDSVLSKIRQSEYYDLLNEVNLKTMNTKPYIVVVSGDYESEESLASMVEDDSEREDVISKIQEVVDQKQSNLVIGLGGGANIKVEVVTLERYTEETTQDMQKILTQSILTCMGVPESRVMGIQQTSSGSLNSNAESTLIDNYRLKLVEMNQHFNDLLDSLFAVDGFSLSVNVFADKDVDNPDMTLKELTYLYDNGLVSGMEVRQQYADKYNLSDVEQQFVDFLRLHIFKSEKAESVISKFSNLITKAFKSRRKRGEEQ